MNEFNILLFGETSAGKSTTINALANYLRYDSFEAAVSGDFVQTIPSKLKLLDPTTYKPLVMGDDDLAGDSNEFHNEVGASVTQCPKSYLFEFEGKRIRVIDTPGISDTGGIEVDKQNVWKFLNYIKTMKTLNAICFIIKTNTTRKTTAFRFCVNELLSLLYREHARTNLVFCFTFSRNSLYGPGNGYDTLKGVLMDNQNSEGHVEIQLKKGGNCYFIDNEAYHYLVARKNGYSFTATKEKSYKESWVNSSASIKQMLTHITKLSPILLVETFTLLEARKLLPQLEEPMEKLITEIDTRVDKIEVDKVKLQKYQNEGKLKDAIALEQMTEKLLKVAEECEEELSLIKEFVIKLAFYLIRNSNSTCEKLIAPYMQLLSPDSPTEIKKFVTTTRSQFEQNQIPKIDAKEIQNFEQQLVSLKHQGSYFKKIIENNQNQGAKRQAEIPVVVETKTKIPKPMTKLILNNSNKIGIPEPTLSPTRAARHKPPMPTSPPPVLPVPTSPVQIISDPTYAVITPQVKTLQISTFPCPILPIPPLPLKTPPVPTSSLTSIPVPTSPVPKTKPTEQNINKNLQPQYTSNIEALRSQRDEESRRTDQLVVKPTLFDFCMPTRQRNNSRSMKMPQQSRQQTSIPPSHVSSTRNHNPNYRNSTLSSQTGKPKRQKMMIEILIEGVSKMLNNLNSTEIVAESNEQTGAESNQIAKYNFRENLAKFMRIETNGSHPSPKLVPNRKAPRRPVSPTNDTDNDKNNSKVEIIEEIEKIETIDKLHKIQNSFIRNESSLNQTVINVTNIYKDLQNVILSTNSNSNFGDVNMQSGTNDCIGKLEQILDRQLEPILNQMIEQTNEIEKMQSSIEVFGDLVGQKQEKILEYKQEIVELHKCLAKMKLTKRNKLSKVKRSTDKTIALANRIKDELNNAAARISSDIAQITKQESNIYKQINTSSQNDYVQAIPSTSQSITSLNLRVPKWLTACLQAEDEIEEPK